MTPHTYHGPNLRRSLQEVRPLHPRQGSERFGQQWGLHRKLKRPHICSCEWSLNCDRFHCWKYENFAWPDKVPIMNICIRSRGLMEWSSKFRLLRTLARRNRYAPFFLGRPVQMFSRKFKFSLSRSSSYRASSQHPCVCWSDWKRSVSMMDLLITDSNLCFQHSLKNLLTLTFKRKI